MLDGDLAWDLVRADGRSDGGLSEADPGSGEGKGQADYKPHAYEHKHGRKRNSAAGATRPDEEIEKEEDGEDGARDDDRRECKVLLPFVPLEEFVHSCRNVAADEAEKSVEKDHDRCQRSTVRG